MVHNGSLTMLQELRVQDYAQGRKIADAFVRTAAFGEVRDPHTEPRISYASSNSNNEAWIRHRLVDSKEPILFVGESENRSLPVALAIMRESWDGIWASSLDKEETQKLPALLAIAQRHSQMNAGFTGRLSESQVHWGANKPHRDWMQRNRRLGSRCKR
jgi:hypothetical protein